MDDQTIGIEKINLVDARELHESLKLQELFTKWADRCIKDENEYRSWIKEQYSTFMVEIKGE